MLKNSKTYVWQKTYEAFRDYGSGLSVYKADIILINDI